jgi:hypothetical protein
MSWYTAQIQTVQDKHTTSTQTVWYTTVHNEIHNIQYSTKTVHTQCKNSVPYWKFVGMKVLQVLEDEMDQVLEIVVSESSRRVSFRQRLHPHKLSSVHLTSRCFQGVGQLVMRACSQPDGKPQSHGVAVEISLLCQLLLRQTKLLLYEG